jgi:hypothetical protein
MSTEKSKQENKSNELYTLLTNGWIDVKEKMPDSGQCVLIYSKDGGVAEGAYLSAKGHFEQWRWNAIQKDVTHWMRLPKPPTCS